MNQQCDNSHAKLRVQRVRDRREGNDDGEGDDDDCDGGCCGESDYCRV